MKSKLLIAIIAIATLQSIVLARPAILHAQEHHGPPMKKGVSVLAPNAGFIRHTLPAMGRAPERTDWGPMAGLFFGHFNKSLTAIVFPYWADANGAHIIGGIGHLDLYFLKKRWYNPVFGVGMNAIRIDVKNTNRGDLNSFAPWGKLGMRFRLPVRGLSITPYVSYLFETVDVTMADQSYNSILFGVNLHYYLNRRLQVALKYYYRFTHDAEDGYRARLRLISSIHDHVGIFLRAEYADQIYDKYVSVIAGPSFVF